MKAVEWLEISLLGIISFDSEELRLKYKEAIKLAKKMEEENQKHVGQITEKGIIDTIGNCANCGVEFHIHKDITAKTEIDWSKFPKSTQEQVGFIQPNIIDKWLEENGNPEITKQVEEEAKELCQQETLEEAIDNEIKNIHINSSNLENIATYNKISGTLLSELKKCMTNIAKWQKERSYNDEDMKEAFRQGEDNIIIVDLVNLVKKKSIVEWFEQFKKK